MPRYTSVYSDFLERLREVEILRSKASVLERSRHSFRHGNEISALCRGSVVLLSSHIEAYVKELGEHTLDAIYNNGVCRSNLAPQFYYYISKERIEHIRGTSQPNRIADHVFSFLKHEHQYWKREDGLDIPASSDVFNSGFSNPTFSKVKSYFGRFGYDQYKHDFFKTLNRDAITISNKLDQIVDTRNLIAHGDPSATKTPKDVIDMIQTSKIFCRTTDMIFGNWCRDTLCNIR